MVVILCITKVDFRLKITTNIIDVVVNLNLHSQYSSAHETKPLLTLHFHLSTVKCVLVNVTCASFLAKASCASDFCQKLSDVS